MWHGAGDVLADAGPLLPAAEGVRGDGGPGGGGGRHRALQRLLQGGCRVRISILSFFTKVLHSLFQFPLS